MTILHRYPLPLMKRLRDRVGGSTIFTKLDLKSRYNLIQLKEVYKRKIALRTCYDHFVYLVMTFRLANVLATLHNMMNAIFKDMIALGVVIYLDNILIYSENEADHITLVN